MWRARSPIGSRSTQRRSLPVGRGRPLLTPEMRQGMRSTVVHAPNPEMRSDPLAKFAVYLGDASFAVQFNESVPLREILEFPLDHRLIPDKRLKQIVRQRHIAARLPVADRLRLLEFAVKRYLRPDVQPECQVGTEGNLVDSVKVVPSDPADCRARDQCENVAVGKNNQP